MTAVMEIGRTSAHVLVLDQYGPFKGVVALVTASVAAASAVIATWWRGTKWHPTREITERLAVLAVAVGLLLLSLAGPPVLIPLAIGGVIVSVWCGYKYAGVLRRVNYKISRPAGRGKVRPEYVVRGDLSVDAQHLSVDGTALVDVIPQLGYDPERVWTPESRATNADKLAAWYLPTVIGGTLALAAAGMAFSQVANI